MKISMMRRPLRPAQGPNVPAIACLGHPPHALRRLVGAAAAALLAACGSGAGPGEQPASTNATSTAAMVGLDGASDGADAPHEDLSAPFDEDDAVLADDDGPAGPVDPADFVLAGYAPSWQLAASGEAARSPAAAGSVLAQSGAAAGTRLYVSTKGSDKNPGTDTLPFKSITRAARAARPGSTVYVAPGTYAEGVKTTSSGNADARIFYVSTTKGGARIVPPAVSVNRAAWDNRGSHVDIVGFEVDGSRAQRGVNWSNGIYNGGSYVVIRHNHVHHIAQQVRCTGAGGSGIGVDSYFRGVKSDVIGNRVHDIGPAGCRFIQGIYISTSGRVMNNVVYRVAEGAIHLWHDANNVIITNNTVTSSNTGIIIGGGNYYHSRGPNDHTAVYSNIVYDNKMGISEQGATGRNNTYRNNLVYQNAVYNWKLRNGLTHSGTVASAPMFAGQSRSATPELKLSGASPAIGTATSMLAADTDFDGRARNASTGYDIGAYQH